MADDQNTTRKIIVELPEGLTLSDEELDELTSEFKSRVIDTKAEQMIVQAKPKEKAKEVPVIVQVKEVALPKEQTQTA